MKLFPEVNYYDVNVMILKPDMFTNIPLGLRNSMVDKPYTFFMVMEDIMNQDVYPMTVKSSKVWKMNQLWIIINYSLTIPTWVLLLPEGNE